MIWIIISIIALITAFLSIYAVIVVFLFKKLLRPRQGVAARRDEVGGREVRAGSEIM
jgi:hypothetical protein